MRIRSKVIKNKDGSIEIPIAKVEGGLKLRPLNEIKYIAYKLDKNGKNIRDEKGNYVIDSETYFFPKAEMVEEEINDKLGR